MLCGQKPHRKVFPQPPARAKALGKHIRELRYRRTISPNCIRQDLFPIQNWSVTFAVARQNGRVSYWMFDSAPAAEGALVFQASLRNIRVSSRHGTHPDWAATGNFQENGQAYRGSGLGPMLGTGFSTRLHPSGVEGRSAPTGKWTLGKARRKLVTTHLRVHSSRSGKVPTGLPGMDTGTSNFQ